MIKFIKIGWAKMSQVNDKYLPIGTVVRLKKGQKKLMIIGFVQIYLKDKDKVYDYMGCVYPEGMINIKNFYFFNHDEIEKIFYIGYKDDEEKNFNEKLKNFKKIKV